MPGQPPTKAQAERRLRIAQREGEIAHCRADVIHIARHYIHGRAQLHHLQNAIERLDAATHELATFLRGGRP